jgi:hypothetical protein
MGVLTQLREKFDDHERTVDRISGFKKFTNPEIGEEKYFKIKEPMRLNDKYKNFYQVVDEVVKVKDGDVVTYVTKLDANGKPRENLPHNLTKNACGNIEGLIRKKLEGREPDEDLNISINSVWKVKGKKNPVSGEGYGDVMHDFVLLYLDGNIMGQVLSGGTPQSQAQPNQ